jgi:exodeoxyribonuclease VII large subunit
MHEPIIYSVSDFVAVFNQTISLAFPFVTVEGELSNFRVSKGRWVYFDLKDETSNVKFFGTVYQLPGPLEDGMKLRVSGTPQLHPNYGFSITMQSISLAGEGTIKKASQILEAALAKEGLFDIERKRSLPYPPTRIGLIASGESAAYSDFLKILNARWGGVEIEHYDVQVQGDDAVPQIKTAIEYFNAHNTPPEVLIITRGGGSLDDLQAFSSEPVVRAVAASRIPTLLAIGHERDVSLAERAADVHASTPSNAAELLVPDRRDQITHLEGYQQGLRRQLQDMISFRQEQLAGVQDSLRQHIAYQISQKQQYLASLQLTLDQINPQQVLKRGYAIVRSSKATVRGVGKLKAGDAISIEFHDGQAQAKVQ